MSVFWRDTADVKFKDGDVKWIKKKVEYLEGSSAGQSGALGSLTVIKYVLLEGFSAGQSGALGSLTVAEYVFLEGFSAGQSGALGSLTVAEIEFYRRLTNSITTFFNALAIVNNFVVRYDNDPRDIPNIPWLETRVDFGEAKQFEIRGEEDNIRCPGIFNVIIRTSIGVGSADALDIADVIAAKFRTVIIDKIINFQIPRIENVGRYEDTYLIAIICPFFVDKIYSML